MSPALDTFRGHGLCAKCLEVYIARRRPNHGRLSFLASSEKSFEDRGIAGAEYAYILAAVVYGRRAKEAGSELLLGSRNGDAPHPG